jgi:hypothetical protein
VTFAQSADSLKIEIKDIDFPEEDIDLSLIAQGEGYSVTSRVVTGDLVTTTTEMTNGPIDVAYVMNQPDEGVISNTGQFGANELSFETAFPAGGADIMNLSAALSAGAFLRGTAETSGGSSETITTIGNEVFSEQSQTSGQSVSRFSIDANGVDVFAENEGVDFTMLIPELFPFPIVGSLGAAVGGMKFPLISSEDPQDVALRFDLGDLTVSDEIWGLFDPAGDLPRDPVSFNLDVAGTVISDVDLLNFDTLESQFLSVNVPVTAESITINELSIAAIGASALATGAFLMDNSDTSTFDGFPRPEGSAILNVTGANGLIDHLVALGVIGQDEAGMARLGMGFIARATGDDAFETRVDVNAEGHVIVNGQRMR